MRQEEQASRGTPLKSTEQMRSTKVSLLKIEVAIDLNISNFSTACFSQANSCWSFLPPPKSWSWLIILYTTWSAHISRDNFGNVITLNQTMLATLHQSLGPFNLSQSYRVPPHQNNEIYDFDVPSKFVLPVFCYGKRKANFCALNHMDVILWWCFTTSCLIILKKTLEKCYSITHLRKCFAKSLKQYPLLRFLVIIKASHCVHSGGWSLALSCEPLALVSSIALQWIYQMLIIPFIYLSLYNCRERNLRSSQSPWQHMLNTYNVLLTNYKCFVLRMLRIHETHRICSKYMLYYSFARLLPPWPLFALLWHRYSVERQGICEAHWTKHQVLWMTTTTEESRSPMVRYDYNSK